MKRVFIVLIFIAAVARLASATPLNKSQRMWVFFTDKGPESEARVNALRAALPTRTLARRAKVLPRDRLVSESDLLPYSGYLDSLVRFGLVVYRQSRWLNAVSVLYPDGFDWQRIEALSFVRHIQPVKMGRRREPPPEESHIRSAGNLYDDYGESANQLEMLGIPMLHKLGYHGEGVLVCMLDTGFRKTHIAFADADMLAEHDFVNDDGETDNEEGDPESSHNHGTYTWSALGGRYDGDLWGPAWGASFILAKTEDISSETPVEEDYWASGIEWAESLGVDVASSSLGYYDWYLTSDMDGDTPVITQAADAAAMRGVTIATAAGNSGAGITTLVAPGDGDSVITVGAVRPDSTIASFSSRGPTFDGRIKPDICALGSGTRCAVASGDYDFGFTSGTSLSTPLIGGAAALLLQVHPEWGPMDVLSAMRFSANHSASPDNTYGWGIPNLDVAVRWGDSTITIPFVRGWNMFSDPFDESIVLAGFPAYRYDPDSVRYIEVFEMEPGIGYFVLSYTDTMLTLSGTPVDSVAISLRRGWNIIGAPRGVAWDITVAPASALASAFFRYDPIKRVYANSERFVPGDARWVLVNENAELTAR